MQNNKQIAKNILYSSISFIINLLITFFFTPFLIKNLGKEAYSFFPLVNNILGYASIFTSVIGSMAGRFVTNAYYQNDLLKSKKYFNSAFMGYIFISFFISLIGLFLVINISVILTIPDYLISDVKWLFFYSILALFITTITTIFSIGTYIKNKIYYNSYRDVISNITKILIIILLFSFFHPSIVYMSISTVSAAIIVGGYNLYYKTKFLSEIDINIKKYFSWKYLFEIISSGVWSSINALSCILSNSVNLLLTNIFLTPSLTADYSIAQAVPNLLSTVSSMIAVTFTPSFNILYAQGKMNELVSEINKSIKIISFIISIPIGFCIINSDILFVLWIPQAYNKTILYLSIITISFISFGLVTNSLFGIFTITNKRKLPSIALFIVGFLNIISIYILLKYTQLGIFAIAFSGSIFIFLRDVLFTPMYGAYCLGIKKTAFYPVLFKAIISIIAIVFISILCRNLVSEINLGSLIYLVSIITFISVIINSFILLDKRDRRYFILIIKNKISKL